MSDNTLSSNQIAVLMHLADGETNNLPRDLRKAFHELWSVNSKLGHDHVEIRHCGGCECGGCQGGHDSPFYSINDNGRAALKLHRGILNG